MVTKSTGLVPVRLRINIEGHFHGVIHPRRGDVVDIDALSAGRYFRTGVCQPAEHKELGRAYEPYVGTA